MLSVVIPAYNEAGAISQAAQSIGQVLRNADIPYELIFVDDGSADSSWEEIMQTAEQDPTVRGISFPAIWKGSGHFCRYGGVQRGVLRGDGL